MTTSNGCGNSSRGQLSSYMRATHLDGMDATDHDQMLLMRQKWQSTHTIAPAESISTGFGRLKKGYATMRKSFRLKQALNEHKTGRRKGKYQVPAGHEVPVGASDTPVVTTNPQSTSLMNSIGLAGATKIFRNVVNARAQSRTMKQHLDATTGDAIQSTTGSFKVLSSSMSQYGLMMTDSPMVGHDDHDDGGDDEKPRLVGHRSEADQELDLRLRRSRRRVLPSSNYKQTNSEQACQGLDLTGLEEIKRDNLRLTLLRTQALARRLDKYDHNVDEAGRMEMRRARVADNDDDDENNYRQGDDDEDVRVNVDSYNAKDRLDNNNVYGPDGRLDCRVDGRRVCRCKSIEQLSDTYHQTDDNNRANDQVYCTCASISSSFSSINSLFDAKTDVELDEEQNDPASEEQSNKNSRSGGPDRLRRAASQPEISTGRGEISSLFTRNKIQEWSRPGDECGFGGEIVAVSEQLEGDKLRGSSSSSSSTTTSAVEPREACQAETCQDNTENTSDESDDNDDEDEYHEHYSAEQSSTFIELEKLCGELTTQSRQMAEVSLLASRRLKDNTGDLNNSTDERKASKSGGGGGRKTTTVVSGGKTTGGGSSGEQPNSLDDNGSAAGLGGVNLAESKIWLEQQQHQREAEQQVNSCKLHSFASADDDDDDAEEAGDCVGEEGLQLVELDRRYNTDGGGHEFEFGFHRSTIACQRQQPKQQQQHEQQPDFKQCASDRLSGVTNKLGNHRQDTDEVPQGSGGSETDLKHQQQHHHHQSHPPGRQDRHDRRSKQERRRKEIMLSLTNNNPDYWHELVASNQEATGDNPQNPDNQNQNRPAPRNLPGYEEHIYSSIYGSLAQEQDFRNYRGSIDDQSIPLEWSQKLVENQFDRDENDRRLFEEQLKHMALRDDIRDQMQILKSNSNKTSKYSLQNRTTANNKVHHANASRSRKKSLFTRLKQLVSTTGNGNKKQQQQQQHDPTTGDGVQVAGKQQQSGNSWSPAAHMSPPSQQQLAVNYEENQESRWKRWQKSRTLTSKSTQSLFNSSMRLLSSSRKSMNLVGATAAGLRHHHQQARDADELMPGETDYGRFFASKSFMSGFLTLGRRGGGGGGGGDVVGSNKGNHHDVGKHEFVGKIFSQNNQNNNGKNNANDDDNHHVRHSRGRRRHLDDDDNNGQMDEYYCGQVCSSVDSLPSADSGLSFGANLQAANSSSSEENYQQHHKHHNHRSTASHIKSTGNIYMTASQCLENNAKRVLTRSTAPKGRPIVGRARAKVDCNPCAYDKEALVFKKGDIIDILERHQSGTWIGRCNGQVGHFKFINVTELTSDSGGGGSCDSPTSETNNRQDGDGCPKGGYVTKLEIKGPSADDSEPLTNQSSSRRSISMSMINQESVELTKLSDSSESIMSSLEQLLFAIGLADERIHLTDDDVAVGLQGSENNNENNNEKTLKGTSAGTYLEILNKGGINDLQSFSAIDHCKELEQIGIRDDEHQRRLLMAAKIIRQASQAARKDFVENYRVNKSMDHELDHHQHQHRLLVVEGNGGKDKSLEPPVLSEPRLPSLPPPTKPLTTINRIADGQQPIGEQPIYVNLVCGGGQVRNGDNRKDLSEIGCSQRLTYDEFQRCTLDESDKVATSTGGDFNRGQSIRVSSRNFKRINSTTVRKQINDFKRVSNGDRLLQQQQQQQSIIANGCIIPSTSNNRQFALGHGQHPLMPTGDMTQFDSRSINANDNWLKDNPRQNFKRNTNYRIKYTNEQRAAANQSNYFLPTKRAQINNSNSAYDLRLNLTHFFS